MKKTTFLLVAFMLLGFSFAKAQNQLDRYTEPFNKDGGYGYLYGLDGKKWSGPNDLPKEQVQALIDAFSRAESATNLQAKGITITNPTEIKYIVTTIDGNYIMGKKGSGNVLIVKTNKAIFIASHPSKAPNQLKKEVFAITDFLIKTGY